MLNFKSPSGRSNRPSHSLSFWDSGERLAQTGHPLASQRQVAPCYLWGKDFEMNHLIHPHLASARILYGSWFISQLLCCPSNFLLVAWESSRGWPNPWGPAPAWETQKSSWFLAPDQLSSSHCGRLGSEPSDGRSSSLFVLLSVYLAFQ